MTASEDASKRFSVKEFWRQPHIYVVDAGSASSRVSRMTLDTVTGLIQKERVGEVGEKEGISSKFILGGMLQVEDSEERRAAFDCLVDTLTDMLASCRARDATGETFSLGITIIATAAVRQHFDQLDRLAAGKGVDQASNSSASSQLRAEFGSDMSKVAARIGVGPFDALVLSPDSEALYEARSALFALSKAASHMKFDGLVSAGGMSSQMVWFDGMRPLSVNMAWKPVVAHYLESLGSGGASEVEAMKKKSVTEPETLHKMRDMWIEKFLDSEERRQILTLNSRRCSSSSSAIVQSADEVRLPPSNDAANDSQIAGRWVFISGFVAFFGALGMVPLERLGSDVPAADPSKVRAYFFGNEYGSEWQPPQTFTVAKVRSFLATFFEKVPGISAPGGIPADADAAMKKALQSAAQYMRVATGVHLSAVLGLFADDAEIYFSKAEFDRNSGKTIEYSVNVGYALGILVGGTYSDNNNVDPEVDREVEMSGERNQKEDEGFGNWCRCC